MYTYDATIILHADYSTQYIHICIHHVVIVHVHVAIALRHLLTRSRHIESVWNTWNVRFRAPSSTPSNTIPKPSPVFRRFLDWNARDEVTHPLMKLWMTYIVWQAPAATEDRSKVRGTLMWMTCVCVDGARRDAYLTPM